MQWNIKNIVISTIKHSQISIILALDNLSRVDMPFDKSNLALHIRNVILHKF